MVSSVNYIVYLPDRKPGNRVAAVGKTKEEAEKKLAEEAEQYPWFDWSKAEIRRMLYV